jgi:tRNA(Arg) A34 adenosine deaminase TadA
LAAWTQDTASSPTRAEVKQEGQQALKQGETPVGDKVTNKPDMSTRSTTTRSQVKGEAASAPKPKGGDVGTKPVDPNAKSTSTKSREQVKAETRAANREGDIPTGDLGKGAPPDVANKPSNRKAAKAASSASQ